VATADAIVSGLAPGRPAPTLTVGYSICGSGDTGRRNQQSAPVSVTATESSVVPTGRRMKGAERFIASVSMFADELLSVRAAMQKPKCHSALP
jgi:hypothetical protein